MQDKFLNFGIYHGTTGLKVTKNGSNTVMLQLLEKSVLMVVQ